MCEQNDSHAAFVGPHHLLCGGWCKVLSLVLFTTQNLVLSVATVSTTISLWKTFGHMSVLQPCHCESWCISPPFPLVAWLSVWGQHNKSRALSPTPDIANALVRPLSSQLQSQFRSIRRWLWNCAALLLICSVAAPDRYWALHWLEHAISLGQLTADGEMQEAVLTWGAFVEGNILACYYSLSLSTLFPGSIKKNLPLTSSIWFL